ncbi:MAG: hypothetical protein RIC14_04590 [Filomicrobium sp.]
MSDTATLRAPTIFPEAVYWTVAGTMVVAFVLTLVVAMVDSRTINGIESVWAKPLKFELSLAVHAATLALVISSLSAPIRSSTFMNTVALAFLAACVVEMGYIITQAARAEASHFNVSSPFHSFMWSVMAVAAIVIIGAAGTIGAALAYDNEAYLSPALRWAIVIGLIGGTLLTLYTAFTIGARMSPYVGTTPHDESARMAMTGWSLVAGDLRVSHFFATHMIQLLPLIGLISARFAPERFGITVVVISAFFWTILTLSEYNRALSGKPSPFAVSTLSSRHF